MGTIIIVIIAVVVIAIIVLAKKGQEDSISTCSGETSCLKQQEVKVEMQKQLQELVRIGTKTLVSLEMTRAEKEDLIGNVIDSIRENTQGYEEEKELVFQIMRKSYAALLSRFSFDKEFCSELLQRSETFELEIKNGTIETYGWDELIEMIEAEKKKVMNMHVADIPENTFSISFAVKGLQYRDEDAQDAAYGLEEGDYLELEKEPDNEYDPYAVKVLTTDGYHIGYVEATKAKRISSNIDKLIECKVKKISEYEDLFIYGLATFKE